MNLDMYVCNRNVSGQYHKVPHGINATSAKRIASIDISKECGEGKFYSKNYLSLESKILNQHIINFKRISL